MRLVLTVHYLCCEKETYRVRGVGEGGVVEGRVGGRQHT